MSGPTNGPPLNLQAAEPGSTAPGSSNAIQIQNSDNTISYYHINFLSWILSLDSVDFRIKHKISVQSTSLSVKKFKNQTASDSNFERTLT